MAERDREKVVNNIVINIAALPAHVRELILEHVESKEAAPSSYVRRSSDDYDRGYEAGRRERERDRDDYSYHN